METRKWMPGGLASCAFSPQAENWGAGRASPEVAVDGRVLPALPALLGGDAVISVGRRAFWKLPFQ